MKTTAHEGKIEKTAAGWQAEYWRQKGKGKGNRTAKLFSTIMDAGKWLSLRRQGAGICHRDRTWQVDPGGAKGKRPRIARKTVAEAFAWAEANLIERQNQETAVLCVPVPVFIFHKPTVPAVAPILLPSRAQ